MELGNPAHKKIGIFTAILVAAGVTAVTVYSHMNTGSTSAADQAALGDSPSTVSLQPSVGATGQVGIHTPVNPAGTPSRRFSDDDEGDDDGSTGGGTSAPVPVPPPAITTKATAIYKNGTYSATASYMSPGGQDQVAVTLTLINDIITDVSVTPTANDSTSRKYQGRFVSGYKQYVVGQNISTVKLTIVSGSSLTPIGFNSALELIKAQAKA